MTSKFYFNIFFTVCLTFLGGLYTQTLAQAELDQKSHFSDIEKSYRNVESETVIRLASDYLKTYPSAPDAQKILLHEWKAFSQLDLRKKDDAKQTILNLFRIDPEFEPDQRNVPPDKVAFVNNLKPLLAKLVIVTDPPNLNISINGDYKNAKSPCFFTLIEGEYILFIESPDTTKYKNWTESIVLKEGKDNEKQISLEAVRQQENFQVVQKEKAKKAWYKNPYILGAGGLVIAGVAIIASGGKDENTTLPPENRLPMHPGRPQN